jgi:hypothetical protein
MACRLPLVALVSLLCAAPILAQTGSPVTAQSAYDAKDWKTCAALNAQAADRPVPVAGAAYDAACCLALSGDKNGAFTKLLGTPSDTLPGLKHIQDDADLTSLHDDPRWQPLLDKLQQDQVAREQHYDAALRKNLSQRVAKDQDLRNRWIQDENNATLQKQVQDTDRDNTAWLKGVVQAQGWPPISKVGRDGAQQAWILVQHADLDPAFQEHVLVLMQDAVAKREASGSLLAYLTDRVRTAQGKPQVYGTQFGPVVDGKLEPQPMEDPEHVDERRAAVGLGTMAEYREQMVASYLHKDS